MNPVTFKCKFTGNTVTFKAQYDIDGMRKHPEYEELPQVVSKDEVFPVEEQSLSTEEQPKKMGRPRKEQ